MLNSKRLISILLAACAVGAYFIYQWLTPNTTQSISRSSSIPVKTTHAQQGDMPVFLRSIGTATSPHQVQVRSQIDGILMQLHVRDGQSIKKGELLASIDDRSIKAVLEQQRAELANRKAQLDIALLDLKRYAALSAKNAISRQTVEQQQALVNQLKQSINAQQASIKEQEVKLSHTRITSPIAGVVGVINVHEGNYVRTSDSSSIFSIVQINPIQLEMALPQNALTELPFMQSDTLQNIAVYAYDKERQTLLAQGHLVLIDNQVSISTGTIKVRAEFNNDEAKLWPGQTLGALIELRTLKDSIIIPQTAVRQGSDSPYVWRVTAEDKVTLALSKYYRATRASGCNSITKGDEVVIDGASRLKEGASIQRSTLQHAASPSSSTTPPAVTPTPLAITEQNKESQESDKSAEGDKSHETTTAADLPNPKWST